MNDIREVLGETLLFRYLDDERRDKILSLGEVRSLGEGELVIHEGEVSPYVYAVLDGEVSVGVTKEGGKNVYICTIGRGEIFGEAGIFMKTPRTANVMSLGESRVFQLHRKALLEFIKDEPSAGIKILMIVVYGLLKKLRESNQELAFERKSDVEQADIDVLVESLMKD